MMRSKLVITISMCALSSLLSSAVQGAEADLHYGQREALLEYNPQLPLELAALVIDFTGSLLAKNSKLCDAIKRQNNFSFETQYPDGTHPDGYSVVEDGREMRLLSFAISEDNNHVATLLLNKGARLSVTQEAENNPMVLALSIGNMGRRRQMCSILLRHIATGPHDITSPVPQARGYLEGLGNRSAQAKLYLLNSLTAPIDNQHT